LAPKNVSIWYDPEGDYFEVIFEKRPQLHGLSSSIALKAIISK